MESCKPHVLFGAFILDETVSEPSVGVVSSTTPELARLLKL